VVVAAQDGRLTLRGIVADDKERARVEEVAAAVPGAKGLANELRTMKGGLYRFPSQVKDKG
jgi:osmotically-inducible protein OsmY